MSRQSVILCIILAVQALSLIAYTAYVGIHEGWNFLQVALNDVQSLTWRGQFGLDFSSYLVLSGIWIMWRNKFSWSSIGIATVAMIIGIIVFAPYVIYLIVKENYNIKKVLIGEQV